jgi:hypothetical protein
VSLLPYGDRALGQSDVGNKVNVPSLLLKTAAPKSDLAGKDKTWEVNWINTYTRVKNERDKTH